MHIIQKKVALNRIYLYKTVKNNDNSIKSVNKISMTIKLKI